MPLHDFDLFKLRAAVRNFRPKIDASLIDSFINNRIYQCIDYRPYWADTLKFGIISIPAAYTTGTISVTAGSQFVTGTATGWPTNDIVNTTMPSGNVELGVVEVTPAAMTGITLDSMLHVDASGTPETVAVLRTTATSFFAKFTLFHADSATITQSSLAGRQFRSGTSDPIFTIRAARSATQLELDQQWGGPAVAGSTYQIVKIYYTLDPNIKDILELVDPQWGFPSRVHVTRQEIQWRDPQQSSTGISGVLSLYDYLPNENGNMQYALWPPVTNAKQMPMIYTIQWPKLENETDIPPYFINPWVFIHGAIADALRWKAGPDDPYHNTRLADHYEQRFLMGREEAASADESKALSAYKFAYDRVFGAGGANFWQSHDPDAMFGEIIA